MTASHLKLLVLGCKNPPETFLERMFGGLVERGVEVTLVSRYPQVTRGHASSLPWVWSPRSEGGVLARGAKLAAVATAAAARDVRHASRIVTTKVPGRSLSSRVADLLDALPLVGRRFDVVYFPWIESAARQLRHLPSDAKVIVSCRGSQISIAPHNPRRASSRDALKTAFDRATLVHCVSDRMRNEALHLGLPASKARVVRPAVDPDFFSKRPPNETSTPGSLRIVSTGNMVWLKGFEYLVHAVAILRAAGVDAQLEIIGSGPERARVAYTAHDLGIEAAVALSGALPPANVRERLQQADVFVLASLSEGISNAVLEGMSCGLPVVTTDCGGMGEAVSDGVEGFVVPLRHPHAMADALAKLAASTELRGTMGDAARARIERDFMLNRQIDAWMTLLSEATS